MHIQIKKAKRNTYFTPSWYKKIESIIPTFSLNFLNEFFLNQELGRKIFSFIPNSCPFDKSYVLEVDGKVFLIYYVPALCKLNPFYAWITDVKFELSQSTAKEMVGKRI